MLDLLPLAPGAPVTEPYRLGFQGVCVGLVTSEQVKPVFDVRIGVIAAKAGSSGQQQVLVCEPELFASAGVSCIELAGLVPGVIGPVVFVKVDRMVVRSYRI